MQMQIVVYRKCTPAMLWGRFAVFANARKFVDLMNSEIIDPEQRDFVAFDCDTWEEVWSWRKRSDADKRKATI